MVTPSKGICSKERYDAFAEDVPFPLACHSCFSESSLLIGNLNDSKTTKNQTVQGMCNKFQKKPKMPPVDRPGFTCLIYILACDEFFPRQLVSFPVDRDERGHGVLAG